MGDALERGQVAAQQLAAPERPVGPHPGPVEHDGERLAGLAVLGEARGGVGVVMLHLDERQPLLVRPTRRQVVGMEVAGDRGGLDAEHVEVEREVGAERAVGGLAVEVAEVRREERLAAARDAERALQLGTRGDERRRTPRVGSGKGPRGVAARAPHAGSRPARPSPRSGGGSAGRG